MGTGITDVIGGPHDFLPDRSDEFQKLCNTREHFSSNQQISVYLVFVVLWYENMSADINISDKFSSYEELLVFKGNRKVYFYSIMHKQFLSRTSQTLNYFFKRNPSRKASVELNLPV